MKEWDDAELQPINDRVYEVYDKLFLAGDETIISVEHGELSVSEYTNLLPQNKIWLDVRDQVSTPTYGIECIDEYEQRITEQAIESVLSDLRGEIISRWGLGI